MLLTTISWILIALTLLPLWRNPAWWVRVLDFPRLQLSALLAITLIANAVKFDSLNRVAMATAAAALGCLVYQMWWILPYLRFAKREVKQSTSAPQRQSIGILIFNVLQSNRRSEDFLKLIEQHEPDLVVTLETDLWWQDRLADLEPRYPYSVKCPLDNLYGMHLYSRLPLEGSEIRFIIEPHVPSIHTQVLLRSGEAVRLHCLHPTPPVPHYTGQSEERDAELLVVGKSIGATNWPVIVTGDLNDVAWSETTRLFRKISGLLDPRVGRSMLNTFHTGYWFLRWPLDHVFHSSHFRLFQLKRLPSIGSDHFPVLVELVYECDGTGQQGLTADQDDHQLAEEKINAQAGSEA